MTFNVNNILTLCDAHLSANTCHALKAKKCKQLLDSLINAGEVSKNDKLDISAINKFRHKEDANIMFTQWTPCDRIDIDILDFIVNLYLDIMDDNI